MLQKELLDEFLKFEKFLKESSEEFQKEMNNFYEIMLKEIYYKLFVKLIKQNIQGIPKQIVGEISEGSA